MKRGIGFRCAFKNVGFSFGAPEQCTATVELHGGDEIERVVVRHAAAEVGQGMHTVIAQMAAEAAGVPLDKVAADCLGYAHTGNSGSVSASRMTFMAGNSVKGAVAGGAGKMAREERPAIATYQYRPPRTTPYDPQTGKSEPNFAYGYVAQAVTVEVDTETGRRAHAGRHLRRRCRARRSIHSRCRARSKALWSRRPVMQFMENFVQKGGYVQTQHLSTYLIPTVLDMPDRRAVADPGISRSDRPVGGAWDGRDAFLAAGAGDYCCGARCHRGMVQ